MSIRDSFHQTIPKIDGAIKEYYVCTGNNVKAGDFVNFINGVKVQYQAHCEPQCINDKTYSGSEIKALLLPNDRVFITYTDEDYCIYATVLTIKYGKILYDYSKSNATISTLPGSAKNMTIEILSNGNVLIIYQTPTGFRASIAVIQDTAIKIEGSNTDILTGTNIIAHSIRAKLIINNRVFIAYTGATGSLCGKILTINNTTIISGSEQEFVTGTEMECKSIELLSTGNLLIIYTSSAAKDLYGIVVQTAATSTSVTLGSKGLTKLLCNNTGVELVNSGVFADDVVAITYTINMLDISVMYIVMLTINNTTITIQKESQLGSFPFCLLPEKPIIMGNILCYPMTTNLNYDLYFLIFERNGYDFTRKIMFNTYTASDPSLAYSKYNSIPSIQMENGTILALYSQVPDKYYLYGRMYQYDETQLTKMSNTIAIAEEEIQVITALEHSFDAVALSSGSGGKISDAYHSDYNFSLIPQSDSIHSVDIYNNELLYGVGSEGAITQSSRGLFWTTDNIAGNENIVDNLNGIYLLPDCNFAVGDKGLILSGTTPNNWSVMESGKQYDLYDICYKENATMRCNFKKDLSDIILAGIDPGVGDSGIAVFTTSTGYKLCYNYSHNASNGNKYVMIYIMNPAGAITTTLWYWHSTNGISTDVTQYTLPTDFGHIISKATDSKGQAIYNSVSFGLTHVAVGSQGTILTYALHSGDLAWNADSSSLFTANIKSVCYGDGRFVAVGDNGFVATSYDGISWIKQSSGVLAGLEKVKYLNNNYFYAVGANGTILRSVNGVHWSNYSLTSVSTILHDIDYSSDERRFFAVGNSGTVLFSYSGDAWGRYALPEEIANKNLYTLTYYQNNWIATGEECAVIFTNYSEKFYEHQDLIQIVQPT